MPDKDEDAANIEGLAPGGVGLLIIDMINSLAFEGAEEYGQAPMQLLTLF